MTKSLLNLIHEGSVHIAPGSKVLKAESFSTLMDAEEVLRRVQEDARLYRQEVVEEIETEKLAARQAGFAEGLELWASHVAKLEEKIASVQEEMKSLLAPLAIKAAQKMVGRELEMDEKTKVDIVANSMRAISQHQVVKVFVHPSDYDLFEAERDRLRAVFDRLESLTVQVNEDVEPGACTIETEAGIINVELEHQWERLKVAIGAMVKQEVAQAEAAAEPVAEESTEEEEREEEETHE